MKIFLSLLVLMVTTSSFSQERPKTPSTPVVDNTSVCKFNFDKLKPIFIQDSSLYTTMNAPEKDTRLRTLRQGVVLKNGSEIRNIKSGCTNYIFFMNIRPVTVASFDSQYLFQLAIDNLKLIPVVKDEEFNVTLLLNALDKRNWPNIKADNSIYILPCSDGATCTLRPVIENGSPRDLEIIYNKAL